HHQTGGAGARDNGVPYASFGLVWRKFGAEVCDSEKIAARSDEVLVSPIDYADNQGLPLSEIAPTIYPYTIDRMIAVFNDTYAEKNRDRDAVFFWLVDFAKVVLLREVTKMQALEQARPSVEGA